MMGSAADSWAPAIEVGAERCSTAAHEGCHTESAVGLGCSAAAGAPASSSVIQVRSVRSLRGACHPSGRNSESRQRCVGMRGNVSLFCLVMLLLRDDLGVERKE